MAENFGFCGYYRMSPLFSFLVLFPRCLPSMARFAFVSRQNALPKPLFSDSNHSLTALWMDRWRRSSPASWKDNGISSHADVFYENGAAKQPPLHTDKIKTESLGEKKEKREKICILKSKFFSTWALSFFAFCMQSCGGAGDVPDLGGSWRRRAPVRCPLLCGDLRCGFCHSCVCVKHMGCPKGPSLEILSFKSHGLPHFWSPSPAGIPWGLMRAVGSVHIHVTECVMSCPQPAPTVCPLLWHQTQIPSCPTDPTRLAQPPNSATASQQPEPKLGALLLIRGLFWGRRRHPCSSPNFNHS